MDNNNAHLPLVGDHIDMGSCASMPEPSPTRLKLEGGPAMETAIPHSRLGMETSNGNLKFVERHYGFSTSAAYDYPTTRHNPLLGEAELENAHLLFGTERWAESEAELNAEDNAHLLFGTEPRAESERKFKLPSEPPPHARLEHEPGLEWDISTPHLVAQLERHEFPQPTSIPRTIFTPRSALRDKTNITEVKLGEGVGSTKRLPTSGLQDKTNSETYTKIKTTVVQIAVGMRSTKRRWGVNFLPSFFFSFVPSVLPSLLPSFLPSFLFYSLP
jgi:hypothetical protein